MLIALLLLAGIGCGAEPASPTPQPSTPLDPAPSATTQQLRIVNLGPTAAADLIVIFPGQRIPFGDVSVGATTAHRPAPGGVYRYAAYTLTVDGRAVSQPVIDWVGEQPMAGRAFTYTIEVDGARSSGVVRLVRVTRDE